MKIKSLMRNPKKAFLYCERYVNDGSPSKIKKSTSFRTNPRSLFKSYNLNLYSIVENDVVEYIELGEKYNCEIPCGSLLVHPDCKKSELINKISKCTEKSKLEVVPLASGRTVKAIDNDYFIKLTYLNRLGRITRQITSDMIRSSIEVTNILVEAVDKGLMPPKFSIFKENFGQIVRFKENGYEWGTLFREAIPFPYTNKIEYVIPFFSLFGKDKLHLWDKPLIVQMLKKQTKYERIEEYLLEEILYPLYSIYFNCLLNCGIELEAHAQNMLVSIGDDMGISRIICRDLESAGKDIPLMDYLHLNRTNIASTYKTITDRTQDPDYKYPKYTITHSFMFDFKLGEYITTPLLKRVKEYYPQLDIVAIGESIKAHNKQFIDRLPPDFFPPEWCSYENKVWGDKKRVYIYNQNPKYR